MNTNIQNILRQGEGLKVEFKMTFNTEAIETLVAFVNAKGGSLYVGVGDNGEIVGVQLGKESIQQWINEIKSKTAPSIIPDVEVIEIADVYMRSMQYSWDAYYSNEYTVKDLDLNKVQRFIDKVNTAKRFNLTGTPIECLEKLKYISGDKVTNAAVLLFAKEGSVYNVHLGRFKTPSMIIDDKMLRLTLFDAVEDTQKYLISQMKVAFEITGITTQRTEILEYPLPAIRELILNCLIHRDYLSPIDVQIKVFDNYITFYNPGKLYGDLTIEDLKTNKYQAIARNKMLAEAFYLTGDIEKYGSGFRRIREELSEYPTMKIEYEEISNGFLVTVSYTERKTSTKDVGKEKRQNMILIQIRNNPAVTINTLAEQLGINEKTVKRDIALLKKENKIARIDGRKSGKWLVID